MLPAQNSDISLNVSSNTEKVLLLKQLAIKAQASMLIISQNFEIF